MLKKLHISVTTLAFILWVLMIGVNIVDDEQHDSSFAQHPNVSANAEINTLVTDDSFNCHTDGGDCWKNEPCCGSGCVLITTDLQLVSLKSGFPIRVGEATVVNQIISALEHPPRSKPTQSNLFLVIPGFWTCWSMFTRSLA